MSFLRTLSARRLIALLVAVAAIGAGGAAIALAATGGGPTPPPKPLANAVRDAVTAPPVAGVTARIAFTNKLIDSSSLQGSNPILTGATGRLWASADGKVRLELQSDAGDAQVVSDGSAVTVYDATSNTAYRATLPRGSGDAQAKDRQGPPTLADVQRKLAQLMQEVDLSGATPSSVAGRPAYTVRVSPKHDGGLLGAAEIAWDSQRGIPLRAAVYAQGSSTPVLELRATDISFGPLPAATFDVTPPANAKTVTLDPSGAAAGADQGGGPPVTGPDAVAKRLPFALAAPGQLVGLPRRQVRLLDWKGRPGALVTYGKGLGGIAVIEQASDPGAAAPAQGDPGAGLSLPTVSIGGATGQELDTALGTMVRFSRGGVDYTVLGSVPPAAAEAAARGL